jgi:hypothetical protein
MPTHGWPACNEEMSSTGGGSCKRKTREREASYSRESDTHTLMQDADGHCRGDDCGGGDRGASSAVLGPGKILKLCEGKKSDSANPFVAYTKYSIATDTHKHTHTHTHSAPSEPSLHGRLLRACETLSSLSFCDTVVLLSELVDALCESKLDVRASVRQGEAIYAQFMSEEVHRLREHNAKHSVKKQGKSNKQHRCPKGGVCEDHSEEHLGSMYHPIVNCPVCSDFCSGCLDSTAGAVTGGLVWHAHGGGALRFHQARVARW